MYRMGRGHLVRPAPALEATAVTWCPDRTHPRGGNRPGSSEPARASRRSLGLAVAIGWLLTTGSDRAVGAEFPLELPDLHLALLVRGERNGGGG